MKKNVAGQKVGAQMTSATDGSNFTGSVTCYVTLDAGTQAVGSVGSGACTHEGQGYHTYAPAQAETNGDLAAYTFVGTGAVSATVQIYTSFPQTGDVYAEATNGTYGLSALETLVDGVESALTTVEGKIDTIDGIVDLILADTGTDGVVVAAGSKTGYSLTATTGLGNQTANITGNLSGSVGSVTGAVGSVTGAVGSVTGNVGGNVTGSVGSIAAGGIAASSFAAGAIDATAMNVTGSEFTAIPWNAAWDAEVQSEVQDALEANNLDHLVKLAVDTNFATTVHLDSVIGQIADAGGTATFDRTTDALEILGAATAPSAATIADAVWDEAIAGHAGAGSTGEALAAAGSAGDPWTTALPGAYGAGTAGYIIGNDIPAILVDTGTTLDGKINTIDGIVDSILVDTGTDIPAAIADLPTNAELATALGTADDAVLAAIAALNDITVADIIAGVADGSYDLQEMMRVIFAACAGKSSGHESGTPAYRDAADTKDRISATTDANGNRTAVTLDAT